MISENLHMIKNNYFYAYFSGTKIEIGNEREAKCYI